MTTTSDDEPGHQPSLKQIPGPVLMLMMFFIGLPIHIAVAMIGGLLIGFATGIANFQNELESIQRFRNDNH